MSTQLNISTARRYVADGGSGDNHRWPLRRRSYASLSAQWSCPALFFPMKGAVPRASPRILPHQRVGKPGCSGVEILS
ncbi:hypothetical protein KCP76_20185 [Salmonella enterica subsp. enterica serovar Weltevreden]|nr:hypothetical protein KCP76_20185 [Salmonella enterica subsp. enterica serovar Weltevreden]